MSYPNDDGVAEHQNTNDAACYAAATKHGMSQEAADMCDDGECCCPECPWKKTARKWRPLFGGSLRDDLQAAQQRIAELERDNKTLELLAKMRPVPYADTDDGLVVQGMELRREVVQLRDALIHVQPYFEGEHHHDHPHCKLIASALSATEETGKVWERRVKAEGLREFAMLDTTCTACENNALILASELEGKEKQG